MRYKLVNWLKDSLISWWDGFIKELEEIQAEFEIWLDSD